MRTGHRIVSYKNSSSIRVFLRIKIIIVFFLGNKIIIVWSLVLWWQKNLDESLVTIIIVWSLDKCYLFS